MPTFLLRAVFFVSSYAPLLVLFAALDAFRSIWSSVLCLVIGVGSVLMLALVWRNARALPGVMHRTAAASHRDIAALAFFSTYVVPFIAVGNGDRDNRLALLVFLAVIATLYLRTDLFYLNPVLGMAGIRIYEVTLSDGNRIFVWTNRRYLPQAEELRLAQISRQVYLEVQA